eukprot:5176961-Amphidinium_carterae.1
MRCGYDIVGPNMLLQESGRRGSHMMLTGPQVRCAGVTMCLPVLKYVEAVVLRVASRGDATNSRGCDSVCTGISSLAPSWIITGVLSWMMMTRMRAGNEHEQLCGSAR